jgi:uroporphyrinogen III methyltransferase/synthase
MSAGEKSGRVYLVGAGPGALDLVTLRARELVTRADVLVYDYLCNPAMLAWTRPGTEIIYAGKSGNAHTLTQDQINELLVARAQAGKKVVRLKGGDPYVFGRGGEEGQVLARAGIAFEVVPGVTSAIAAPAYAGIPVTHRDFASTVTFVTGHEDPTKAGSAVDWKALAELRGTKVFLMGVERLGDIAQRLMAEGMKPSTPVALVRWGTTARQETLTGTLATIAGLAAEKKFAPPAITIVGDVVSLRPELNWFEQLPLFGKRIVVTRSRARSDGLAWHLARLGADVLEIPTIRIEPVALGEVEHAQLKAMAQHFDWIVFTSLNAVNFFFDEMSKLGVDIRQLGAVKLAAVGPTTAGCVTAKLLKVDLQPAIYTTEKLAEEFARIDVSGVRFCLPHGNLADPLLANQLRENGGTVTEWKLYNTVPETEDITGMRARFVREGAHFITFTSASTVENWNALKLRPEAGAPMPKMISMGPVTSRRLRDLDYKIASEAPEATVASLVATIRHLSIE